MILCKLRYFENRSPLVAELDFDKDFIIQLKKGSPLYAFFNRRFYWLKKINKTKQQKTS